MIVVAHNMAAMNADRQLKIVTGQKSKSAEKLSSGYRINRAADDAAGLAISEKMRYQIRGLDRGLDNTRDGISFIQVADGAMDEVDKILQRMNELAVQASNDTNTSSDRAAINLEVTNLKKVINRIGKDTEFNTLKVFDGDVTIPDMTITGKYYTKDNIGFFNSSFDAATHKAQYGGFLVDGNRIPWNKVDPNLASEDPATGKTTFKAGTYKYDPYGNDPFVIEAQDGTSLPKVTREIKINGIGGDIYCNGQKYSWESLIDGNGRSMENAGLHSGTWHTPDGKNFIEMNVTQTGGGTQTRFSMEDYLAALGEGLVNHADFSMIESFNGDFTLVNGASEKSAGQTVQVTKAMADAGFLQDQKMRLGADKDGVWIEKGDATGSNWTQVNNSKIAWSALNPPITDSWWKSGIELSQQVVGKTITYTNNLGTDIGAFSFTMSVDNDVTSLDSLINAVNGTIINGKVKTDYKPSVTASSANVLNAEISGGSITFDEEKGAGRDFDTASVDDVIDDDSKATVDFTSNTVKKTYSKNSTSFTYDGSVKEPLDKMRSHVTDYITDVIKAKELSALSGSKTNYFRKDLKDVVGAGNITTSGHFTGTVTLGKETYASAVIDFKKITDVMELAGTGFDSTCMTCNNHYSVLLEPDAMGTTFGSSITTADGKTYKYSMKQSGQDYELRISLDSMKQAGVKSGSDIAEALKTIVGSRNTLGHHFTQYETDGSKLYIYDNRPDKVGDPSAKFQTQPYDKKVVDDYSYVLINNDKYPLTLKMTYSIGDLKDWVNSEMKEDSNGDYVKETDGSFRKYDKAKDKADAKKYSLNTTFKDKDGNALSSKSDLIEKYSEAAIEDMLSSKTQFNAVDYTICDWSASANAAEAEKAEFASDVKVKGNNGQLKDYGLNIQHSSNVGDATKIPRFALNTFVLGIIRADCSDFDKAQATMDMVSVALDEMATRRSIYGAYQNRLEHTYANNGNVSENTQVAESRIRDTDMAKEMTFYSMQSILQQAGQSMLAQTNQINQGVLDLLH